MIKHVIVRKISITSAIQLYQLGYTIHFVTTSAPPKWLEASNNYYRRLRTQLKQAKAKNPDTQFWPVSVCHKSHINDN